MLDWSKTAVAKDKAKNKDRVAIVCEQCGAHRDVLYLVAKRRQQHPCMSCLKRNGKYKCGELVTYTCVDCNAEKEQPFDSRRWHNWRCHHCAMKKGHKDGKFTIYRGGVSAEGKKKISAAARARWKDPEYRKKWKKTRDSTKEKRSAKSKELWSDPVRLKKLSDTVKKAWQNADYRYLKTKQSQELWNDQDYAAAQKAGYTEEVKEIISSHGKVRWVDPVFREKMAEIRASQLGQISSIQKLLYGFLDDLGVDYEPEGPATRVGYYVFDCLVRTPTDDRDLLVECQGDYWHSVDGAAAKDQSKFTYVDKYFPEYEIMYVWEHEFGAKDRVLDRIKLKLGIDIPIADFSFDNVNIGTPTGDQLRSFLDSYHYIGKGRGGKCFAAFLNGELIACCVFSSPLRQNTASYFGYGSSQICELSRFCIHPSYHRKNFASWFIARCLKLVEADAIIAYADSTVGHRGTIYKASGFKLHHVVPADYWYVDLYGYVMHKRTLYGRACRMGMKESDFAAENGYVRKYGGEKLCYIRAV